MPLVEPAVKRAIAFVDGQNLFHSAKKAFGHSGRPRYLFPQLAEAVCRRQGWRLEQARFYTGVPSPKVNPSLHAFWDERLREMSLQRVAVVSRQIRYRPREIKLADGTVQHANIGEEKGIDVRIALDIVALALDGAYDVAVLFSQDQDLAEAGRELQRVQRRDQRWLKFASAYPDAPRQRGINESDWLPFDQAFYEACCVPGPIYR